MNLLHRISLQMFLFQRYYWGKNVVFYWDVRPFISQELRVHCITVGLAYANTALIPHY